MDYENLTPQYRIEEYLEAIVEGWAEATQYPYPDYPSWRIEEFLDAFITYIWEDGDHPRHPCPEPVWHIEECLRAIYDVMTGAATPWAFPTPTNRIEEYLAAIYAYLVDGTELPVPEPAWRIEQWLAYVLDAVKQGGGVETTVSGTLVHITNALAKAALSVLASIEPIQDLHGYSSPWPAGGGKNKLNFDGIKTIGVRNGSATWGDNTVTITATSNDCYLQYGAGSWSEDVRIPVSEGDVVRFTWTANNALGNAGIFPNGTASDFALVQSDAGIASLTVKPGYSFVTIRVGVTLSGDSTTYSNLMVTVNNADTTFATYSNICPISGRTGLSVYVGPTQDQQDATTYAIDWTSEAGTVYGGTLDVVTGVLTVDRAYIASYNGETINEPWVSSMDAYAAGTTPTIGAQVVYTLATPITYQLTAQEVQMLLGENYVWSSSGDTVSVTYYAEGNANPLQSLNILLGGNYSNPKTADDVSDREALEIILGGNK